MIPAIGSENSNNIKYIRRKEDKTLVSIIVCEGEKALEMMDIHLLLDRDAVEKL